MLLFILAFIIFMRRSSSSPSVRYGAKDYYQQYRRQDGRKQRDTGSTASASSSSSSSPFGFSYSSRWDKATERASQYNNKSAEEAAGERRIAIIVIILAIAAIAISTYFQAIEGLLVVFTLPIIVRFLRARRFNNNNHRRRTPQSGGDSPSI